MLKSEYFEYIFKVDGETIKGKPEKMFEPNGVYLIIDKDFKLIWIWSGSNSRLFHRYMAANWAGKLKTKKKFYNFKYEVIKQGIEPSEFNIIFQEIKENRFHLSYPGESRNNITQTEISEVKIPSVTIDKTHQISSLVGERFLAKIQKSQIKKILSEIKEMQQHIKYTMDHIQQRFTEIEKILEK
ncbi:MAG: hypothetical protein ACFFB0_14310 [Promethearchaeota archaeon]